MRIAWIAVVAVIAAAVVHPPMAVGAPAVATDVRVGQHGDMTRFVLDLSAAVPARIFTLDSPYRVVIDLTEIGWRLPAAPLPEGIGLFDRFRYGLFEPGTTRVVIETTGPAAIAQARYLGADGDARFRLLIDLVPTSRQAFLASLRAGRLSVSLDDDFAALSAPASPAAAPAVIPAAASVIVPAPRKPPIVRNRPLVVLDAGHGGADPGAVSAGGTYEKHVTLTAAREFKALLEATGRYRAALSRQRDIYIPLRDRVAFAREAGADLFVSLHADSIPGKRIAGLAVYTLSERASDQEAAELAERENKADLIAGMDLTHEAPEVATILIDLAQRETMNESARFAAMVVQELGEETRLLRNSHRFAGFRVLKAPDIPSVLLEMGFLSNREEERLLLTKEYRAKLGRALLRAADAYFSRIEEAQRR